MTTITCVYDEGSKPNTPLIGAKGTAFLVEHDGKKVLFDTGLRDRYLIHNIENMDIDPDSIDAVVVSQTHPDNAGALNGLLKIRTKPMDVYAPTGLYDSKKSLLSSKPSISDGNKEMAVFKNPSVSEWTTIFPGIYLSPRFSGPDGYAESYLVAGDSSLAVISGRGSYGPEDILTETEAYFGKVPKVFIGSVLLEKKKKPLADAYAASFSAHKVQDLYLNHCTSREGITNLRVNLGLSGVNDFYVGMEYKF